MVGTWTNNWLRTAGYFNVHWVGENKIDNPVKILASDKALEVKRVELAPHAKTFNKMKHKTGRYVMNIFLFTFCLSSMLRKWDYSSGKTSKRFPMTKEGKKLWSLPIVWKCASITH